MQEKILIIGLDGATWTVLKPMVEQGIMPKLGQLMKNGCWGNLRSVIPPVTASAWASFMTGKNPDKHGIFDFRHFSWEGKEDYITNASHINGETIWQMLSRHGKKIIVLNVPYTYPVYPVNGILISGMDSPSKASDLCYPPELKAELAQKFPDYSPVISTWNMRDITANIRAKTKYIARLKQSMQARTQTAIYLLQQYEWDIAMIHFQEVDFLQHVLFKSVAAAATGNLTDRLGRAIRDFWGCIDSLIAQLWECASAVHEVTARSHNEVSSKIFVVSDHGFGIHIGNVFPNTILEKRGLLKRQQNEDKSISETSYLNRLKRRCASSENSLVRIAYTSARCIRNLINKPARRIKGLINKPEVRTVYDDHIADTWTQREQVLWRQTHAAMVTGSHDAFILALSPEEQQNCIRILKEEEHPAMGGKIFREVLTFEEAYGRAANSETDLYCIAIPQDGFGVSRGFSDDIVKILKPHERGGIHRPEGILVACGNGLNSNNTRIDANLIDMVPSLLAALNLPIPNDVDGEVRFGLFADAPKVQWEEATEIARVAQDYSEEDRKMVEKRLRALGYL